MATQPSHGCDPHAHKAYSTSNRRQAPGTGSDYALFRLEPGTGSQHCTTRRHRHHRGVASTQAHERPPRRELAARCIFPSAEAGSGRIADILSLRPSAPHYTPSGRPCSPSSPSGSCSRWRGNRQYVCWAVRWTRYVPVLKGGWPQGPGQNTPCGRNPLTDHCARPGCIRPKSSPPVQWTSAHVPPSDPICIETTLNHGVPVVRQAGVLPMTWGDPGQFRSEGLARTRVRSHLLHASGPRRGDQRSLCAHAH